MMGSILTVIETQFLIIYRWYSSIELAEDINQLAVNLIQSKLESRGETVWRDETDLITSDKLKEAIETAMKRTRVVIMYLGSRDLERCLDQNDFLRWEIDLARELESKKNVRVAILVYGTPDWRDLFPNKLRATRWGKGLMEYFESHYITFFRADKVEDVIEKLRSVCDRRRKAGRSNKGISV